jgi:hypothetical protein
MTEQEYLDQIAQAEQDWYLAKRDLAEAKKVWVSAETQVIDCKIALDRIKEDLRVYRSITPTLNLELREQEIEKFRKNHPELCQWADQRDKNK